MNEHKTKHQAQNEPDVQHLEEVDSADDTMAADKTASERQEPSDEAPAPEQEKGGEQEKAGEDPVARMQKKADELNDRMLRLQAEFDNYRKRSARERLDLILTAGEDVIKGMLPVLDDCQRAIQTLEKIENADPHSVEGVKLIYHKLFSYLQTKGLKPIEAKGHALNTDLHAAVAKIPAPEKKLKGKIVDVVLEGYTLNGKEIRFANVVVGE